MTIGDSDFGVQVGVGFLGRVTTILIAFLGSVFLARILGPEGYGAYYLFAAIAGFLDNPITGWARACKKRFTEVDFPSDEALGSILIGIGLLGTVVLVGSRIAAPIIERRSGEALGWLFLTALVLGPGSFRSLLQILKGTNRFGVSQWVVAIRDVVRVLIQVGLVVLGFGVAGMVWGMAAASLLLCPLVVYLAKVRPAMPTADSVRNIWEFGRYSIPLGVLGTAKSRMDIILLGAFATTASVGYYEIALKMTTPAIFIASVASSGLVGRISELDSRGEGFADDIRNNVGYVSILAIPIFFGAVTVGPPVVVTIYGSQFSEAGAFIAGLALYQVALSQNQIHSATLAGLDRPDLNLRISVLVFLLNVAVGLWLLFEMGPIGVVIATVIAQSLATGLRAYFVQSLVPSVSLLPRPLIHQIASGVAMAFAVVAIRGAISLAHWSSVAGIVVSGAVVYFGLLIGISKPFRTTVVGIMDDFRAA